MRPLLKAIRHVVLDMDGTIYRGKNLFPTTLPFLQSMATAGIDCTFLTNNPSLSNADYQEKLRRFGISIRPEQLYTSTQATIEYMRQKLPKARRLFVLGTPSMARYFQEAGYELLDDDPAQRPDAVVVGFDLTLTYARLCRAGWWLSQGVPYLATNPDRVCPTDEPTLLIDCGSITAALEKATERAPMAVLGKPDVSMLEGVMRRHKLAASQLAMVGDRLYTDVAMAQRAGAVSVLVLTGETTAEQAAAFAPPPDIIARDLGEFGAMLSGARQ